MNEPNEITEGIWEINGLVSPGPGFRMDTRMTIVRLEDEALLLHSPVALDDQQMAAIDSLGTVEHLVSPNLFHQLFLKQAVSRWPDATVWGSPGLADKLKGLEVDEVLESGTKWPGIEVFEIAGMPKFQEFVLFHRPSSTLLLTDLVFNRPHGHNLATRLFFRVFGTYERFAVSRLFKSMIQDKTAFGKSLAPLLDLPVERIVVAHGEILEANAKARLQELLSSLVA